MASHDIIAIGGSLGGFDALRRLSADLPSDLPAALLVVVHIGEHVCEFAGGLQSCSALPVTTAEDGASVQSGKIYIAPAGQHLLVLDGTVRLGRGPRENMARPAVNPLFRSAAVSYGPRVIGVVLTGLLNDGASGLAAIKQCGGLAVVQNPADARADGMPLGALRSCNVDYRADAAQLGGLLAQLASEDAGPPVAIPPEISLEVEIALGRALDTPTLSKIADPAPLSCPQCSGVLSEIRDKPPLRYRCQVGHAFTAEVLNQEQEGSVDEAMRVALRIIDSVDEAMRVALRIIEERATLADGMADDARANGRHKSALMFEERSKEMRGHAETIR